MLGNLFEEPKHDMTTDPVVRRLTMLIVDDEPNVCFTLKLIFEREGFEVRTANSAAEGLRALNSNGAHDLVLADLHMEREDIGLDLVRAAKKLQPAPIVIVMTGYASMRNARAALDVHVDHFAIKPIELPDFLEAVRRLVGQRSDAYETA